MLLKIKESGFNDSVVIGAYVFYNLIYAAFSYPLGIAADRIGMRKVLFSGFALFAVVYAGIAYTHASEAFFGLFFLYGIYAGATEGVAKAWITNISDKSDTATAIGTYTAFQSIAALVSSSCAGIIWHYFGSSAVFLLSGGVAAAVGLFILRIRES